MATKVRSNGRSWLEGPEAALLQANVRSNPVAVAVVEDYFKDWRTPVMSLDNIVEYFINEYLGAGAAGGQALRQNPVSAIVRCLVGDHARDESDRLVEAREIREKCPEAFWFMTALANKHSSLCQEVLRSEFKSDALSLKRGVHISSKHFAIESWAYHGPVTAYGPTVLRAEVPLNSIVSLCPNEHEIVVLRHPWESNINVETPQSEVGNQISSATPWRNRLADRLDAFARRLRRGPFPK